MRRRRFEAEQEEAIFFSRECFETSGELLVDRTFRFYHCISPAVDAGHKGRAYLRLSRVPTVPGLTDAWGAVSRIGPRRSELPARTASFVRQRVSSVS